MRGTFEATSNSLVNKRGMWPVGFQQGDEASSNLPSQYGGAHDSIHRQYTTNGRLPKSSGESPRSLGIHTNESGVNNPSFWVTGELNLPTPKFVRRETPPYQDGGQTTPT